MFCLFVCLFQNVDELKQKLLCTSIELEQLKMEANEELRKNKEYAKQLLQLLKMACQERDEARDQFQKLMNKVMYSSDFFNGIPCQIQPPESSPSPPQPPPPPPLLNNPTTKGNSSITESNSHSENYNYHTHGGVGGGSGSSPVDSSFFDPAAVSSSPPELMADSNINLAAAASFVPPHSGIPKLDQGSILIENLSQGKSLPQRGKFLKAVLDSGPLLQNLLVAGPLPRWRNPPQLQTFHIPPVSVSIKNSSPPPPDAAAAANASDINNINPRNFTNLNQFGSRFQNQTLVQTLSRPYTEMSCASSQMMSNSMLNFANVPTLSPSTSSGACMMMNSSDMNGYAALGKRQRLH